MPPRLSALPPARPPALWSLTTPLNPTNLASPRKTRKPPTPQRQVNLWIPLARSSPRSLRSPRSPRLGAAEPPAAAAATATQAPEPPRTPLVLKASGAHARTARGDPALPDACTAGTRGRPRRRSSPAKSSSPPAVGTQRHFHHPPSKPMCSKNGAGVDDHCRGPARWPAPGSGVEAGHYVRHQVHPAGSTAKSCLAAANRAAKRSQVVRGGVPQSLRSTAARSAGTGLGAEVRPISAMNAGQHVAWRSLPPLLATPPP